MRRRSIRPGQRLIYGDFAVKKPMRFPLRPKIEIFPGYILDFYEAGILRVFT